MSAFTIVRDFEKAVSDYTGAPFVVATTSCSMALFLVLQWYRSRGLLPSEVGIPKLTYVSVPMAILNSGSKPIFRDEDWQGMYQLKPLPLYDAARRFTSGMYAPDLPLGSILCTSHHWAKILGVQQGGCILHDNREMDSWLRRARFDGRTEGVPPNQDRFTQLGWHAYLSPEVAAEGLVRIGLLRKDNPDLPRDDYPDLSLVQLFQ